MTYDEALRWWFGRVNYEVQPPLPSDLKLDRMRAVLARLGNPQSAYPIVHVAGSKGKGSTAAMLAAMLQASGRRVGLFTSPHLQAVEERVQVDSAPIDHHSLAQLLTEVRRAAEGRAPGEATSLDESLTFFEIATAVGMLHFARQSVDLAVIEVGLGGRFDSTNVCEPAVAVITSISFDHTQQLGNTLASIAFEKAGIIKPGRPVVSGVVHPEAGEVIRAASRERNAPLRERGVDFDFDHEPARINGTEQRWPKVRVRTWHGQGPWREVRLIGAHQAANAAVAVATVHILREQGMQVAEEALTLGLARVRWPARLEVVGRRPLLVLDCAHNVASAEALAGALLESFPLAGRGRRALIFAGNRDKDLRGMLAVLAPLFDRIYLTRFGTNPRCLPPDQLSELVPPSARQRSRVCATAAQALAAAQTDAGPDDLICAAGSVFLAGELRALLVA
ncbi:MAG: bifunctional folylpolyglutamate synthase/dihydrofolate synthase [Gemmataceae bacterium]|nr:bifunctional folylpolyglutamate synthase/dihydrofolate synthase [Gemmataceae bacterium]